MTSSRRILNDLRTLRRLLLEERTLAKASVSPPDSHPPQVVSRPFYTPKICEKRYFIAVLPLRDLEVKSRTLKLLHTCLTKELAQPIIRCSSQLNSC